MQEHFHEDPYAHQYEAGAAFGPVSKEARQIILEKDQRLVNEIKKSGGFDTYVDRNPEVLDAFTDKKPFLCCMDERTGEGTIRIPGSGIGIEDPKDRELFKARLTAAGVEGVYSHDQCGAVNIYAKKNRIDDPRQAAIEFSQNLAAELGVKYLGHLKNSGGHPGGTVYYDTTGRLDTGSAIWQQKMPTGFSVSRNFLNSDEAKDALILAVKIAFGAKGHGAESFTTEHPLTLVGISDEFRESEENFTSDSLRRELEDCYEDIIAAVPEAEGKIAIDGISLPEEIEEDEMMVA